MREIIIILICLKLGSVGQGQQRIKLPSPYFYFLRKIIGDTVREYEKNCPSFTFTNLLGTASLFHL